MMISVKNARAIGLTDTQICDLIEQHQSVAAERMRNYRANVALRNARNTTPGVLTYLTSKEVKSKEVKKVKEYTTDLHLTSDAFETFWRAYPKRPEGNPKKPAALAFARAVRAGAAPEAITAGAERLAANPPEETKFIPHAATWLNQRRWESDDQAEDSEAARAARIAEYHRLTNGGENGKEKGSEIVGSTRQNPRVGQNGSGHAEELRPARGLVRARTHEVGSVVAFPNTTRGLPIDRG